MKLKEFPIPIDIKFEYGPIVDGRLTIVCRTTPTYSAKDLDYWHEETTLMPNKLNDLFSISDKEEKILIAKETFKIYKNNNNNFYSNIFNVINRSVDFTKYMEFTKIFYHTFNQKNNDEIFRIIKMCIELNRPNSYAAILITPPNIDYEFEIGFVDNLVYFKIYDDLMISIEAYNEELIKAIADETDGDNYGYFIRELMLFKKVEVDYLDLIIYNEFSTRLVLKLADKQALSKNFYKSIIKENQLEWKEY